MPTRHLIVGLGNPGAEYAASRHNLGFMAVDAVAASTSGDVAWQKKFGGEIALVTLAGTSCLLLKPLTYMNLSGEAVGKALRFYDLSPADVIVMHDDIDLIAGRIKVKQGGGHGGHNGLKSIDAHIGKDYWRVRLGIGRPPAPEEAAKPDVTNHVLSNFSRADKVWREPLLDAVARHLPLLFIGDNSGFIAKVEAEFIR